MMRRALLGFAVALAGAGPLSAQDQAVANGTGALLRGLDKVAGVATDITLGVGESTQFGRLTITLSECRHPVEEPAAEAFAYLVIHDTHAPEPVFRGWMIASSPALNALDHARFDVWVLRCTTS
jgi:hypothetical protein